MFRKYKPKNSDRVDAIQVTEENLEKVAELLHGRVFVEESDPVKKGVEFPTFDGVKKVYTMDYLVRWHSANPNAINVVSAGNFEDKYEIAVNRAG